MRKLAELNFEIKNLLDFNIDCYCVVNNFTYNGHWVNEIPSNHFSEEGERIVNLLNDNINYNNKGDVLVLKHLNEEIRNNFSQLIENEYDEISTYSNNYFWGINHSYPAIPPLRKTDDVELPNTSNYNDSRSEFLKVFVDDYNKVLKVENKKAKAKHSENEELVYAKAHLWYVLTLHIEMIKKIGLELTKLIDTVNLIESLKEEENEILTTSENGNTLQFDLSKTNLGHLFYNLYEIGIIARDKSDIKDERSKLKNYLDSANLYYLDNKSYSKVQKMTRVMPVTRNTDSKVVNSEIVFLETLTSKLNNRIADLKLTQKNLNKRGH